MYQDTRLVLEVCLFDPNTLQRTVTIVPLRDFSHEGYTIPFYGATLSDDDHVRQSEDQLIFPRIGHVRYERGEVTMLVLQYDWLFPYGYSPSKLSSLVQNVAVFKMQLEGEGARALAPVWGTELVARNVEYVLLPSVMPIPYAEIDDPEQVDEDGWDPDNDKPWYQNERVVTNFETMVLGRHTIFAQMRDAESRLFFLIPFRFRFNTQFVRALNRFHRVVEEISDKVGPYNLLDSLDSVALEDDRTPKRTKRETAPMIANVILNNFLNDLTDAYEAFPDGFESQLSMQRIVSAIRNVPLRPIILAFMHGEKIQTRLMNLNAKPERQEKRRRLARIAFLRARASTLELENSASGNDREELKRVRKELETLLLAPVMLRL